MSAYYSDGLPYNFERIEFDGTHVQFTGISGLFNEIKIAVARPGNVGGFVAGDFFTGNGQDGQITKISDNGKDVQLNWATLAAGAGLMRGSLFVDHTGAWGGDLIAVTTNGQVWRINSKAVPTKLADVGTHLEGMITVPADEGRYGFLAGKIIAGNEDNGRLYCFDSKGTVNYWKIDVNIEDIDFIFPRENFFGVNYGQGRLLGAKASDFKGLEGEILISQESVNAAARSAGFWILKWDPVDNVPYTVPLILTADSEVSDHWEHVTFAKAGVLEIPDADPLCYKLTRETGQEFLLEPMHIGGGLTAIGYYAYNSAAKPFAGAFAGGLPPVSEQEDTLLMYFTLDYKNALSLVFHVDSSSDGTGGKLQLQLKTTGVDSNTVFLQIQDDGTTALATTDDVADTYFWS